jgi:hypothetical protein
MLDTFFFSASLQTSSMNTESCFLKSGNTYKVSSREALDLHEKLPAGNFVIKVDMAGQLYLEQVGGFSFRGKQYGDHATKCQRIFDTFMDRTQSTGVMLTGEKGSGKSLLAKLVSIKGQENGVPTIIINSPMCGDKFNAFITAIKQPAIILFDEFEKVYDEKDQEKILTLLDGVFPSKKLFIITCNDKWRIDSHMRNRPGRIYYMLDFDGLDESFIIEYCEDNLKKAYRKYVSRIAAVASLFHKFNFDMLKALVEEINRYGEAPEAALKMLNVKPEFEDGKYTRYAIKLAVKGEPIPEERLDSTEWTGNPLTKGAAVGYTVLAKDSEGDDYWDSNSARFTVAHIKKIDPATNTYTFENETKDVLTLTRIKPVRTDYMGAF